MDSNPKIDDWISDNLLWPLRNAIVFALDRYLPDDNDILPHDLAKDILEDTYVLRALDGLIQGGNKRAN